MTTILKTLIFFPVLPFYLLFSVLRIKKVTFVSVLSSFFQLLIIFFVILPMFFLIYYFLGNAAFNRLGYIPVAIPISGTGSMYPTFPKGKTATVSEQAKEMVDKPLMFPYPNGLKIFNKRYFSYNLQRGDIIEFENKKTDEITKKQHGEATGMVKRIIGIPGDTLEIKDGMLIINNIPLNEPYIAQARSTFGGSNIAECKKITIPSQKLFVMGDNRKVSGDSRHALGLINYNDVFHVIPLSNQKGQYDKNWRDTSRDLDQASKIKLDKSRYLLLLNEKREIARVKALKYQTKLEESAKIRAEVILKFNDFSYEATRSGETMKKAMQEVGYSNIIWGEAPLQGYYTADELIENQFEFPQAKQFLLNKEYEEVGIADVEGEINNCPTQVIVQHFAGYISPNYNKDLVDSWKNLLQKLLEIQVSWQNLKNYSDFYHDNSQSIDRINEIIETRIKKLQTIVDKMEKNLWLTPEEEDYLKQDQVLAEEQNKLASKLNGE